MHEDTREHVGVFLSLGCGARRTGDPARWTRSRAWKLRRSLNKRERENSVGADVVHENMLKTSDAAQFEYYRFDLKEHIDDESLEDWQRIEPGRLALSRIEAATKAYLERDEVQETLDKCAKDLVKRRRQRAETLQWESFALGIRYRCQHPVICREQKNKTRFANRQELLDHLRRAHKEPPPDANNFERITLLLDTGRTNTEESQTSFQGDNQKVALRTLPHHFVQISRSIENL